MTTDALQRNITSIIGLDGAPEAEQERRYSEIGELLMESIMLRALAGMDDAAAEALEAFAASNPTPEEMLAYLRKAAPDLDRIAEEEVRAFKEEVLAVMGDDAPAAAKK